MCLQGPAWNNNLSGQHSTTYMAGHGQVSYSRNFFSRSSHSTRPARSDLTVIIMITSCICQLFQPSPVPPGGPQGAPVPSPLYPWMRSQFGEFADGESALQDDLSGKQTNDKNGVYLNMREEDSWEMLEVGFAES